MKRILIIGANSDIAQACIPLFEQKGISLLLAAHKPELISDVQHEVVSLDVTNTENALQTIESLEFDGVIYAAGTLPDNDEALFGDSTHALAVNYTAAVRILGHIAERFKKRQSGVVLGISSIAAVRGKSSNVVYGSAKAGFDSFLSGLRQYMVPHKVRVVTIRPGYVATKMTEGMNLPKSLTASAEDVAKVIVKNTLGGNRSIIYVKPIWRPIAFILKCIPEPIFKKRAL